MMISGFLKISNILFHQEHIDKAYKKMRDAGRNKLEAVALFAGKQSDNLFIVSETIIPAQEAYSLEEGLLYSVDGEELHKINMWLYDKKLTLIGQIHSHPGQAYHSETDDLFPIITKIGGISIVVPNFAKEPTDLNNWAVYRLNDKSRWTELNNVEKNNLIKIE